MSRIANWVFWIWTVLVASAGVCVWVVCPHWFVGDESASAALRNLAIVAAALVGLPLAVWRAVAAVRQADAAQQQAEASRRSLLNERFQHAARMLGEPPTNPSARLGGIHALARLADESVDLYGQVMQLLAAFAVAESSRREASSAESGSGESTPSDEESDDGGDTDCTDAAWHPPELYHLEAKSQIPFIPRPPKDVEEALRQIAARRRSDQPAGKNDSRLDLSDAYLAGMNLPDANLSSCDFTKTDLSRLRAWQASFVNSVLPGANLAAASLPGADFRGADLRRIDLRGADLGGANLYKADLGMVDRAGQNLWGGRLLPSNLTGSKLNAANLAQSNLSGAVLDRSGLGGAKLDNANLSGAKLRRADLRAASLVAASLDGADLCLANLGGAGADLSDASLAGADLTGANLGQANLRGADLTAADVSGADFAHDHRRGKLAPARGLTQAQLDSARADTGRPPNVEGVLDAVTSKPLVWRSGTSDIQSANTRNPMDSDSDPASSPGP